MARERGSGDDGDARIAEQSQPVAGWRSGVSFPASLQAFDSSGTVSHLDAVLEFLGPMGYLPIFMNLDGRRCVVVGGGEVAERRVAALLEAGARVCVISPKLTAELQRLASTNAVEHLAREWKPGDLKDCLLAFAATDDLRVHRATAAEARAFRVPINVADQPELCDFITPSVVRRGELQIAISTSGASPALASRIRRDLQVTIGPEYETVTQIMRAARSYVRKRQQDSRERARILQAIAASNIAELVRQADWIGIDRLLTQHLGAGLAVLRIKLRPPQPTEELLRGT
jgi:siroheme synthase-like protein